MENWEQQTLLELSGSVEQIIFRNDKNGYTAVSYTHLDVYKRQLWRRFGPCIYLVWFCRLEGLSFFVKRPGGQRIRGEYAFCVICWNRYGLDTDLQSIERLLLSGVCLAVSALCGFPVRHLEGDGQFRMVPDFPGISVGSSLVCIRFSVPDGHPVGTPVFLKGDGYKKRVVIDRNVVYCYNKNKLKKLSSGRGVIPHRR